MLTALVALAQGPIFIPPEDVPAVIVSVVFFITVGVVTIGYPIVRAIAKRMERGGMPAVQGDVTARLERIEQAVEAIAIEVERISEGQRFAAKLLAGREGAAPAAAASLPASNAGGPRGA
jgi:hypothetical protein